MPFSDLRLAPAPPLSLFEGLEFQRGDQVLFMLNASFALGRARMTLLLDTVRQAAAMQGAQAWVQGYGNRLIGEPERIDRTNAERIFAHMGLGGQALDRCLTTAWTMAPGLGFPCFDRLVVGCAGLDNVFTVPFTVPANGTGPDARPAPCAVLYPAGDPVITMKYQALVSSLRQDFQPNLDTVVPMLIDEGWAARVEQTLLHRAAQDVRSDVDVPERSRPRL